MIFKRQMISYRRTRFNSGEDRDDCNRRRLWRLGVRAGLWLVATGLEEYARRCRRVPREGGVLYVNTRLPRSCAARSALKLVKFKARLNSAWLGPLGS